MAGAYSQDLRDRVIDAVIREGEPAGGCGPFGWVSPRRLSGCDGSWAAARWAGTASEA